MNNKFLHTPLVVLILDTRTIINYLIRIDILFISLFSTTRNKILKELFNF